MSFNNALSGINAAQRPSERHRRQHLPTSMPPASARVPCRVCRRLRQYSIFVNAKTLGRQRWFLRLARVTRSAQSSTRARCNSPTTRWILPSGQRLLRDLGRPDQPGSHLHPCGRIPNSMKTAMVSNSGWLLAGDADQRRWHPKAVSITATRPIQIPDRCRRACTDITSQCQF